MDMAIFHVHVGFLRCPSSHRQQNALVAWLPADSFLPAFSQQDFNNSRPFHAKSSKDSIGHHNRLHHDPIICVKCEYASNSSGWRCLQHCSATFATGKSWCMRCWSRPFAAGTDPCRTWQRRTAVEEWVEAMWFFLVMVMLLVMRMLMLMMLMMLMTLTLKIHNHNNDHYSLVVPWLSQLSFSLSLSI